MVKTRRAIARDAAARKLSKASPYGSWLCNTDAMKETFHPRDLPDPSPLYKELNQLYFGGTLTGFDVEWSIWEEMNSRLDIVGGMMSISKLWHKDKEKRVLVETILHGMIHVEELITFGPNKTAPHGKFFRQRLAELSKQSGYGITVFRAWMPPPPRYWYSADVARKSETSANIKKLGSNVTSTSTKGLYNRMGSPNNEN